MTRTTSLDGSFDADAVTQAPKAGLRPQAVGGDTLEDALGDVRVGTVAVVQSPAGPW